MPDFDELLQPIMKDASLPLEDVRVKAPTPVAPTPTPLGIGGSGEGVGNVFDKLKNASMSSNFGDKGVFVTNATLDANRRYNTFNPIVTDYEDFAGQGQSALDQAANGVLKGLNLAATTVLGLGGLLYGTAKAALPGGKFSDVYNNEITRNLDEWNNKVDNEYLPNYYTATQRNASWYSTDNWLTTNFLFDKLIKNAGYAAGAIVSGNIISSGLKLAGGAIGTLAMEGATLAESSQAFKAFTPLLRNTARAFSIGKNIEAAEILRKEISTVADLTETSSKLADIAKSTNAFAQFNDLGRRGVIGLLSSAGESSFEALQTGNEFKRNLIQQYKDTHHGDEPDADSLKNIDALTETVGNVSFLGNMALLGITETVQLPKLLGSSYAAEKRTANALLGKADNVILQNGKYVAASELANPTRFGKIYSRVANIGHYVFDPKEAAQEIGQYALQVGTENYFKKAYETRDADVWVDGVMFGFTGKDKSGKGVGALVSKEGIESGLLGGITGGLMQIKGNIQQAKAEKVNTERFLNDLNNAPTFKEAFKERLDAANRGIVLQQQQQDAVYQGDQLEAKDLKADMMHNYIAPRIKYGRFDMTMDDIAELRQLGSTEKGLASLKQQGYAGAEDTIQSYQERLSDFESVARNTEQIYRSTHLIYSGETITDEDGNKRRKYSDRVIDKMVYSASKIANYDLRLPSVNLSLAENGIDTSAVLDSIIKNDKPNKEATADVLNQINALDVTDTVKDALKTNLSDVIELSLRRKAFLDEYNDIKANPLNYEFLPGYEYGKDVMDKTPVDVVQKEIDEEGKKKETEKKLEIGKEYSLKEPLLKTDGKLALAPKITVLSQTLGGELEVKLPTGKTTFMSPEEFKNYNITDENNTSPEMADVLDKSIDTVLKNEKYAEVKKELDNVPEGMEVDKIGYINSLDNQDLIDAIEEEFNTRTEEIIKQKEEAEKQRKELIKAKNEIETAQKEIELSSGDVATPEPTAIEPFDEGKLKSAAKFFASGTSISEETNDPAQAAPHIKNSREFLNNAKNFKNRENLSAFLVTPNQEEALGLKGLTTLYYDGSDMSMSTDTTIGFVAQVFIEQEGGKNYFVDKNGERLGEVGQPVDINKVIFQAMPTAEIYYAAKDKNGNPIPRFRKGEKEVFEGYAKSWAAERAKLFEAPATTIKAYKFNISRGIAIENELINGVRERNQVGGVLVPESKISSQQDLININTSGTITHNGENLKFPVGRPVLQYGDTLQFLNNNKFGKEKAQNIYQVLKAMTDEFQKTKKINRKYTDFLQNVLYMRKSAQTSGNQIFIDPNTAEISLGGKRYGILDIANKENEIVDQLAETYHNINNFTLSKKFSAPFYEFTFKDGELQETEWKNYQSYLLASKNPDGSKRSVGNTPLATTVAKANPDTVPYSFKQKYATLVDFELPVQPVVKAAAVAAVPGMLGEFKMDGQTKNTFTEFKSGPIDFTGTVDENGDINVDVVQNDTITNAAKNEKLVNETIVPALKAANTFDPSADDVELVSKFVGDKLVIELMKLQQEAFKAEEKKEAPVSNQTKKAELERIKNRILPNQQKRLEDTKEIAANGSDFNEAVDKLQKKASDARNRAFERLKKEAAKEGVKPIDIQERLDTYEETKEADRYDYLIKQINDVYTVNAEDFNNSTQEAIDFEQEQLNKLNKRLEKVNAELAALEAPVVTSAPIATAPILASSNEGKNKLNLATSIINKQLIKEDLESELENIDFKSRSIVDLEQLSKKYNIPFSIKNIEIQTKEGNEKINDFLNKVNKAAEDEYQELIDNSVVDFTTVGKANFIINTDLLNLSSVDVVLALDKKGIDYVKVVEITSPYSGVIEATSEGETITANVNFKKLHEISKIENILNKQINEKGLSIKGLSRDINFKKAVARKYSIEDAGRQAEELENELKTKLGKIQELSDNFNEALYQSIGVTPDNLLETFTYKPTTLTSLEGGKTDTYNPANTSAPEDEYQRVGKGEAGQERLTDSEIAAFKEWHAKNAAGIPFEVLDNLVNTHDNEKAFGVFQEGVAKFYKGALKGTPYHEIAEGIWKSFLTPEQRQAIIEEQRATGKDFVDRETGKTLNYATATDQQIKERIMDDFGDFKAGKIPARSLGEMVRNFFRNIIEFFKSFVSKPSLKDELFKAIDSGKFKEFKVPEIVRTDSMSEYSRIPGLTETEKFEYVDDMLSRAANYIFGQNKKSLYDISRITSNELFNNIKGLYEGEGKYQELGENRWQMLVNKTKQSLRILGINFNEEDRININDENITKNEYTSDPFTTDWKKSSPFAIKITLATLPEVQPTNQQNESSMSLPKRIISSVKGYKLTNFSKAFATVLDKLSNTSKIGKVINKLVDLAKYDATYVRFFQRVGGNVADGTVDFSKFKDEDWRLFVNMMQVFTKQKPNALIQYTDGDSVYTAPANQFTASKQIEQSWFDNMKALSTTPKSIIKYNRETKTYNVDTNSELFPKATPKTTDQMIKFLNDLGVEITIGDYNTMKSSQRKEFSEAVGDIHAYIQKSKEIGSISGKLLGINAQLSKISNILVKITNPNQENTYFGVEGNRIQLYADNNAPSVFENEFNDASTLKELRAERTELNDVFSTNSVILKEGGEFFNENGDRIKLLKVSYIQGSNNLNDGKGTTTSRLTLGNRATQEINQNLSGNYYILIPADGSTEWMINLGNHIKFDDIATGRAWTKINTVFKGYLMDDVALALDYKNREKLKSVGDKAKELRFFKDILSEKNLTAINKMIEEGETQDDIKKYIDENIKDINESIKGFIEDTIERTNKMLSENGELNITNITEAGEKTYSYPGLSTDFTTNKDVDINKFKMSQDDLNNTLLFANANYIINNIEFHKILFGDPYQFKIEKGKLDETKRIKSFLSPRRTTFDSPLYNTFLNQNYNNAGEIALEAPTDESFGDPGYHTFDSSTNTVTVKDVVLSSENYPEINQADAASWIKDTTYREVKLKNGQWSTEAEAWHQWQMAYTRQNLPGYEYTSEALKKHDEALVKTPEPQYVTDVLKPIVSGVKAGAITIDLVLDKFSQMPVYFKAVQGTNLENLYTKMWKEKVGYVIMESGRKVGAQKLHSLYKDGKFNEAPFAQDTIVQVPWKSYGIQVENSFENPKEQTRGSQLTKLFSLDFFNDGQATEAAKKEYDNNKDILDRMHENAYTQLLNKLGIEDLGTSYKMINPAAVSETLKNEMLRRALSENAIDTIELDENGQFPIPFEASPEYQQIKNILYSMVDKSLVSPKMNGAPHVQVPVTMWEKSGGESNTTLAFYSKGKTQTNPCEVMLPHWFKERLNSKKYPTEEALLKYLNGTEEGRSILRGVGFRIPTQSMSSVEVFKVKGFLPKSMGYTVVVPSEITAKAGSDFDIDKLNMYLKATYIDKNGDIRLISLRGDEATTKEFFGGVFDEKLEKKKINKAELLEATQILAYGLDDPNNLVDRYSDILDSVLEGTEDSSEYEAKVVSELEKLGDKTLQATLKEKFVNNMYKKALENEYYKSLENMILLPENYERLLAPVGDAGLKKVAGELDVLRKDDENTIPNRLLNRSYMTSLRNSFVTGKKWVGIAAVNITGQSVTQKSQIYIDPNRFNLVSDFDKKILGNGQIVLPHNTTKVNGVDLISISGNKTADGKEFISDRLSGYATAFVDVAKDPYIMKIIQSNSVVGTFMFLERIGAGKKTIEFLNQPIITEYLKYLNSIGKSGLFGKADIDFIMDQFPCTKQEFKDAGIDVGALKGNIETYYEKGSFTDGRDNAIQQKILREFLKYAKMAEYSFKLTQASNYDTTKFKSGDALFKKQLRTEIARESNIFSSVDKVLEGTFIGNQSELIDKSMAGMGAILKLESDQFRDISDRVLEPFARREFMSDDDYEKLGNKIKASFLDFIIQTKSGINNDINSLLVDPTTSIAKQLAAAKKKYPEMKILNDLVIDSSKRMDGAKTIKLKANDKADALETNMYIEMMRELKAVDPELYNNIVNVAILQGSYQSAVSIKNIIPIEDYSAKISDIINTLADTEDVKAFSKGAFERNNWRDDLIVPTVDKLLFIPGEAPIGEQTNQFGDHIADIFQYTSPIFPDLVLDTRTLDRKILKIDPKYNYVATQSDFIKVPRVITSTMDKEKVDMLTGKTVTSLTYREKLKAGDLSLFDYFGYQKVKDELGNPLVTKKGEFIYKLINLYGDGQYASEYRLDGQPSSIDNGTIKIDSEIPNKDLIQFFAPVSEEKALPSQNKIEPDGLPPIDNTNENSCA